MASRYGRQKKRKAALIIKNLERGNSLLRREKIRSQDLMRDCIRVLGENFVGLSLKTISSPMADEFLRVHSQSFSDSVDYMSEQDMAANISYMVYEIGALRSKVQRDKIDKSVHFRVRHPETGEFAYCISREVMEELPSDILIKRVSSEIAYQLSASLEKLNQTKGTVL